MAGAEEPELRAGVLAVFHFGEHAVVAAALHERAREHDLALERLAASAGERHFHRHQPAAHLFGVEAGRIDIALDAQLVGTDDAGERVARLHPFPLVRKQLHHDTVERALDEPAVDRVFRGEHLHLLRLGRECGQPPLELGLLDLELALLLAEHEAVALHFGDAARNLGVRFERLLVLGLGHQFGGDRVPHVDVALGLGHRLLMLGLSLAALHLRLAVVDLRDQDALLHHVSFAHAQFHEHAALASRHLRFLDQRYQAALEDGIATGRFLGCRGDAGHHCDAGCGEHMKHE